MSDLKPCPFCGATATPRRIVHYYEVECDSCDAAVAGENEADAVAKWNRRAPPKELVEAWEKRKNHDILDDYAREQSAYEMCDTVKKLCEVGK